ncbi:MAG: flagellar hook-basal body complex protein FliE [Alphaproteobacteria bacterium]|nr:flagellar hook-basal body complex protein FliE [Alphaproteobacteria bacterium]
MSIGALDALSAYGRVAGRTSPLPTAPAGGTASGGSFGGMVSSMIGDTSTALKGAESASARQVAGKGDLVDTVTAIGAAEMALDTVVAVRDKVVGAYSEIMRMQI